MLKDIVGKDYIHAIVRKRDILFIIQKEDMWSQVRPASQSLFHRRPCVNHLNAIGLTTSVYESFHKAPISAPKVQDGRFGTSQFCPIQQVVISDSHLSG